MSKICEWFHHNSFKVNSGKFQFLLNPFIEKPIEIMGSTIKARKEELLLGMRIESDLTAKEHAMSI